MEFVQGLDISRIQECNSYSVAFIFLPLCNAHRSKRKSHFPVLVFDILVLERTAHYRDGVIFIAAWKHMLGNRQRADVSVGAGHLRSTIQHPTS